MIKRCILTLLCITFCLNFNTHCLSKQATLKRKQKLTSMLNVFKKRDMGAARKVAGKMVNKIQTQTGAHWQRLKSIVDTTWSKQINKHKKMFDKIIAREQEYSDNYYIFYHAHVNNLRIVHDTLKELYRFFYQPKNIKHFTLLRDWNNLSYFKHTAAFLKKHFSKNSYINDGDYTIKKQLMSLNLSLFGNCTQIHCGECTFQFFIYNSNICPPSISTILNPLFKKCGLNTKWVKKLNTLKSMLKSNNQSGQLLQICIPKEKVDSFVYLSHAFGVPHGPLPGSFNTAYNAATGYHKSIAPVLEQYRSKPFALKESQLDSMQARLLVNKELSDPESGVIIHRYCAISEKQLKKYKQKLRSIVDQALTEWCNTHAQKGAPPALKNSAIDKLICSIN